MARFSNRLSWDAAPNRLFEARQKRQQSGAEIIDLTETNPTRVGLVYPVEQLQEILGRAAAAPYDPHPLGSWPAREAIAEWLSDSERVSPEEILLTASTSEAYSYLFKLLTDPGDLVITPVPAYPLLEHLTAMENVSLRQFPLHFHRRWTLEVAEMERATDLDQARAIVVVHPNNPTGSFLTVEEQDEVAGFCRRADLALISDEVFSDYRWADGLEVADPAARRDDVLSFSLGGLSKSAGLPHWKLGWIRVGGPRALRHHALQSLELIADNYLSVATPVQQALPELLQPGRDIQREIRERVRANHSALQTIAESSSTVVAYPVEGGWSAVVRVPAVVSDEDLAVELLERAGVLVQPGYFFDFPGDGFLVLSLLPAHEVFARGVRRLTEYVEARVR